MPRPQPSIYSRMFFGNLRNKGTSLVFAVLIWAVLFSKTNIEQGLPFPVEVRSSDPDKVVLTIHEGEGNEPFGRTVELELRGPQHRIQEVEDDPSIIGRVLVDKTGLVDLEDPALYDALPPGVTIQTATPRVIEVVLDDRERARRKVTPIFQEFVTSPRFRTPTNQEVRTDPITVEIVGPRSRLANVQVQAVIPRVFGWDEPTWEQVLDLQLREGSGEVLHTAIQFADQRAPRARVTIELQSAYIDTEEPLLVPMRYGLPSDIDTPAVKVSGDDFVELTCQGTAAALEELRRRVQAGEFRIWVPVLNFSGERQSVDATEFRWPEGSLPEQIDRESLRFDPPTIQYKVELPATGTGEGE